MWLHEGRGDADEARVDEDVGWEASEWAGQMEGLQETIHGFMATKPNKEA